MKVKSVRGKNNVQRMYHEYEIDTGVIEGSELALTTDDNTFPIRSCSCGEERLSTRLRGGRSR